MFQDLNNQDRNKNLKMMSISASILVGLFIFMMIKSDHAINGSSYYLGIGFLFVLLILSFMLNYFRDKIKAKLPKNKFQSQLDIANTQENYKNIKEKIDIIEPLKSDISFNNIAGMNSIKQELLEIVDFLNYPKKYQKYGVSLPKGVLLVGPPGVGKTLLAKAVASEANVPFFYQSASSFVNIYVGAGAKKVRELFIQAKTVAPSIIFIDEIDAIGKARGSSNDERESTLNELLSSMDGFNSSSGVIVIAATNKIEVLDEALLRAGRFDRRVFLSLPSKDDRKAILELYLKDKKHTIDIEQLCSFTSGFSSSALKTLVNEALLYMIKSDEKVLSLSHIEYAKQKIQFGKYQIKVLDEKDKEILAIYQAAKAFISKTKVTLLDGIVNKQDVIYPSQKYLEQQIKNYLCGTIALEIIKGDSYIVEQDDIKKGYKLIDDMVDIYKFENQKENLANRLKDELTKEISSNQDKIIALKDILLKEEVIVF